MPKIKAPSISLHKELVRVQVLAAAERAFAERGFARTTLGDIADLADVGRTTVYQYYRDKGQLLVGLVGERVPPVLADIVDALPTDASPPERLDLLANRIMCFCAGSPLLARLIFTVGRKLPQPEQDRMWAVLDPVLATLVSICEEGLATGVFTGGTPSELARICADVIVGGIDELMRFDVPLGELDRVTDRWIGFLKRGLASGMSGDPSQLSVGCSAG